MKTCNDLIDYMMELEKDYETELSTRKISHYKAILGDLTKLIEEMKAAKKNGNDKDVISILEKAFKKEIEKDLKKLENNLDPLSYSNSFGLYTKYAKRLKEGTNPYPKYLAKALKLIYDSELITTPDKDCLMAVRKQPTGFYKAKL